jgi:uncharacterized protein YqeY
MSLQEQINEDIKNAMRSKDKIALEALRSAKTAFTIEKTKTASGTELSGDEELKIVQKLVKQRNDSAAIYKEQGREDLYEKEVAEASILEKYLPAKMSAEELTLAIKAIIDKSGASSMKDMGKVMGMATKELAGKADGKDISAQVKTLLG